MLPVSTDLDISVEDFTEQEFTRALTQCKFGKFAGIDTSMRAETMRFAGSDVQNCLLDVCNKVLNGHPRSWQWKTNIIIPIPKKSTSQHMEDFRGITLISCSETHSPHTYALYQPTHCTTRCGRPRLNYVDYIERLTGMKTNELVEVSQDREDWRELVVACVDLQPPD